MTFQSFRRQLSRQFWVLPLICLCVTAEVALRPDAAAVAHWGQRLSVWTLRQAVTAQRAFSYGNVRDSDPEKSVYTFGDASYGTRAGQAYPLWNWCVLFSDFDVEGP